MKKWTVVYLFEFAWKKIWALVCAAIICAAATFSYCHFVATPRYTATAAVMVTNGAIVENNVGYEKVQGTDISASLSLSNTVVDLLNTPDIYKALAQKLGDKYTYNQLMGMISAERKGDETLFINISTTTTNRSESVRIANAYAALVPEYVSKFVPYSNVLIASQADSARKAFPSTARSTVIAAIIGAVLIYVALFIAEDLNKAVSSENDFVEVYKIPLLGTVPDFENGANESYYAKGGNQYGN